MRVFGVDHLHHAGTRIHRGAGDHDPHAIPGGMLGEDGVDEPPARCQAAERP
jgi:hypothetical protein